MDIDPRGGRELDIFSGGAWIIGRFARLVGRPRLLMEIAGKLGRLTSFLDG